MIKLTKYDKSTPKNGEVDDACCVAVITTLFPLLFYSGEVDTLKQRTNVNK